MAMPTEKELIESKLSRRGLLIDPSNAILSTAGIRRRHFYQLAPKADFQMMPILVAIEDATLNSCGISITRDGVVADDGGTSRIPWAPYDAHLAHRFAKYVQTAPKTACLAQVASLAQLLYELQKEKAPHATEIQLRIENNTIQFIALQKSPIAEVMEAPTLRRNTTKPARVKILHLYEAVKACAPFGESVTIGHDKDAGYVWLNAENFYAITQKI